MRRRSAPPATLGLLGFAVALIFGNLLSADRVPLVRDLLLFFLPFKAFLGESLRSGDLPLWNPWTFLGTPFLASLHTGALYPPSTLLMLPFPLGFKVFLLFHYLAALAGAWILLRFRGLGLAATSVGTLTFVLGGYLVSLLNVTNHLQSAAWVPLALLSWMRHVEAPSLRTAAALSVFLVLQILGGSPEIFLMTVFLLLAWGGYRSFPEANRAARLGAQLGVMSVLAVLVTAFQILPTAELTQHSVRGSAFAFDQMSFWSLEPVSLLQLLFPHSSSLLTPGEQHTVGQVLESQVPWLSSLYVGLVPLCFVVAGFVRGRERIFWGAVALTGTLLALGKNGPLLRPLYDVVPELFGKFRYPEKFWLLVHVPLAILAAEGAERVFWHDREARRIATLTGACFLAIGLVVLALRSFRAMDLLQVLAILRGSDLPLFEFGNLATDIVFKSQRLVLTLAAFLGLLQLQRLRLVGDTVACAAIVGLAVGDLAGAHYNLNLSISWSELMARPPLIDVQALRERHLRAFNYQTVSSPRTGAGGEPIAGLEEGFKVLRNTDDVRAYALAEWPSLPGNSGILYHVGTVVGGEAIDRAEIEMLRDVLAVIPRDRAVHLLRLYSVGALIGTAPLDLPSLRRVGADDSHFAYEVRDPVPRAYLVSRLTAVHGRIATFNALIAPGFHTGGEAVVDRLPEGWRNPDASTPAGEVAIKSYENDQVLLRTRTADGAFLVLNDSWFPGWEALVDGAPVEIHRTNALVRGIVVPPGEHDVRFVYRPLSFRLGAGISAITGILSLAWIVYRVRRPRGPRPR